MLNLQEKLDPMPLAVEYIGSKRLLLDFVMNGVKRGIGNGPKDIADIFSGTGVISATFKKNGFRVSANDHLATCYNLTAATLLNHDAPSFKGLDRNITTIAETPYLSVLKYLNTISTEKGGFIHTHYSPASQKHLGFERRYFTEINAARIDAIRSMIHEWRNALTAEETSLLITDLVRAVTTVSNVAGTYGCYLKQWKPRALGALKLTPSVFISGQLDGHTVTSVDAQQSLINTSTYAVYADPPYTKRQYAAYYHILETIVRFDNPEITGTTGLRNWKTHSSDFCYKRKAERALENLIQTANCEHFFLSYNDDGQIPHLTILELLSSFGKASFTEIELKRYRSSDRPHKGPVVLERLYHVKK